MQGLRRRVIYLSLYEVIAILLSSVLLASLSGFGMTLAGVLAVAASAVAIAWNFVFNLLFEAWEARQTVRGRSVRRRIAHALGFEIGLLIFLVPLIAWWFGIGWWQALTMNAALMVFFLVYTYVFNWTFDRVFGLPTSAVDV